MSGHMQKRQKINHMHTSTELRLMMESDTGVVLTDRQFKNLCIECGYEPVDVFADEWEFRISSAPLRTRSEAEVGGWLPSRAKYRATRLG